MDINSVMKFRTKLIEYGKRVNFQDYLGGKTHIYVCDERQTEKKRDFSR